MGVSPAIFLLRRVPAAGRGRRVPALLAAALGAALLALFASAASAQFVSFGKNKIQYTDFDWRVLTSEHFELYFYPEEDTLAHTALRIAEEAYADIAARYRHEVTRKIPLIIYSSHHHFEETNVSPYFLPEGVAGFTEFLKGRVALPFNGSYYDFEHVIHHELVHVFQLSRMAENFRLHYRNHLVGAPLWFTEGMAEAWSGEWDSTGDLFLADLVLNDLLPPITGLWRYAGTFVNYKIGQDLVMFLERHYGPDVVPAIYDEMWRADSFEDALARVTETPIEVLSERWRHELRRRYFPRVERERPLALAARALAVKGGANFQAAVPPPGGEPDPAVFYFLSPRNGYMNIYRASPEGEERDVEVVVRGQRRPEFESFHGFESRISLSPDGRLAFVSKYHDRDGLFLYDLRDEKLVGKWQFEDLIALRSPTFSPDGSEVIFAGLSAGGRQDLYRFEPATEHLRPLTGDRYDDDDPAWSPDGRTLAFASDRCPAGEEGAVNLFLLDLETGELRAATAGPWRDSAPSWSPDGKRLGYSSDREGTAQIFVADSTGASVRVTSILGGATSPVWLNPREILFTGMAQGRFGIYRAEATGPGDSVVATGTDALAAAGHALSFSAGPDTLAAAGRDSLAGRRAPLGPGAPPLRPAWTWRAGNDSLDARVSPFRSRFTLDFAQGGVVLEPVQGVSEGVQGVLTDQLGDRIYFVQVSNTAQEFGDVLSRFNLGVTHYNLSRRLNYGVSAFHFAGDFLDELGYRYFERRVGGSVIVSYPYSRYSRVESSLGLLHSDREADSFREARSALLAVNYLSFIHDTSLWFNTGPMDGGRYNLTLGLATNLKRVEVENVNALVDLRRYFRTSLRTAYAVRLQGRISEGSYPRRFLLGGSWSFRGYPRRGLVGTRSVLLNQEWRFPLLEGVLLGLPMGTLGLPPVQGALFVDAAQAWEEHETPDEILGSYGLGLRTNLGGFIVLRLDFSRLTDFKRVEPGTEVDFFVGFNY